MNEQEKPKFLATEEGLILNTEEGEKFADKLYASVDKMDFNKIDMYIIDSISSLKYNIENDEKNLKYLKPDLTDFVKEKLFELKEKERRLIDIHSKIFKNNQLSFGEISEVLNLISANKGWYEEKNKEDKVKIMAAEIFLRRELAKKEKNQKEKEVKFPDFIDNATENEERKEKRENKEIFQQQIENNSHKSAKSLKSDLAMFIRSVDGIGNNLNNLQSAKYELSEILNRSELGDYEKNKEIKINGKDKEIFQPILNFRKELDEWNKLTETRITDFKKRLLEYVENVFGMETLRPKEGEVYKYRKEMQTTKVEETKNELLNGRIKKVISLGFKINEELYNEYKNWFAEKEKEISKKWHSLKDTLPKKEFDKIIEKDQAWLKKHSFEKSITPARVEIYKYKTE